MGGPRPLCLLQLQEQKRESEDKGKGPVRPASASLGPQALRLSFNSVSWSSNSQVSSSVSVFFFLLSLIFFSRSLIFFFLSFSLSAACAFTSILFPAPSKTSSCTLLPEPCSSSASALDSPSMRRYPPFMIHPC